MSKNMQQIAGNVMVSIDDLVRLESEATPGPWDYGPRGIYLGRDDKPRVAIGMSVKDGVFLVLLRNEARALLDAARERDTLRTRCERLEATLKETRDACAIIDEEWDIRGGDAPEGDGSARLLLRDIAKGEYP